MTDHDNETIKPRAMPAEPADPHPSDEDRSNVHNPSPGGDTHSEGKDGSIDRLRKDDPGSPA